MISIDAKQFSRIKSGFFDRAKVKSFLGAVAAKALNKSAGRIRTFARRSMRRKKNRNVASPPGQPPFAHGGQIRDKIFYAWINEGILRGSLLVGPLKYSKGESPRLNEFGGKVFRSTSKIHGVAKYPPRPFMAPALRYELPNMPEHFRSSAGVSSL